MFRRHRRNEIPTLNTTSTADISFMLLIFFLVTSSMDTDKGLRRQLPPLTEDTQQMMDVNREHLLTIGLDAQDCLTVDSQTVTLPQLQQQVEQHIRRIHNEHILSLNVSRKANYDAYFQLQNTLVAAYNQLRNEYATQKYGHPFRECSFIEREDVAQYYPQRISETVIDEDHAE
ncbi:MAG: biopolymer transporter ExbD [Prevotella sp.]|nr:biopolymer transporter ExbD [Prevotella sp.]